MYIWLAAHGRRQKRLLRTARADKKHELAFRHEQIVTERGFTPTHRGAFGEGGILATTHQKPPSSLLLTETQELSARYALLTQRPQALVQTHKIGLI